MSIRKLQRWVHSWNLGPQAQLPRETMLSIQWGGRVERILYCPLSTSSPGDLCSVQSNLLKSLLPWLTKKTHWTPDEKKNLSFQSLCRKTASSLGESWCVRQQWCLWTLWCQLYGCDWFENLKHFDWLEPSSFICCWIVSTFPKLPLCTGNPLFSIKCSSPVAFLWICCNY